MLKKSSRLLFVHLLLSLGPHGADVSGGEVGVGTADGQLVVIGDILRSLVGTLS